MVQGRRFLVGGGSARARARTVGAALVVALVAGFGSATAVLLPTGAAVALGPEAVQLSEAEAMAIAKSSGQRVEVSSLTTETRQVFADPLVGGFVAELSAVPARTRQADGSWRDVDLTLVRDLDGSVRPVNAAESMRFSGGGTAPLASIESAGTSLGVGWPRALPEPVLDGPTATYPEVLPGVDLVAKAGAGGYGTYLVVKDAAAARNPTLASLR